MTKTVSKNFLTIDVLNILSWMEKEDGFLVKTKLPIKIQWAMNKNLSAFNSIRDTFKEFEQKLQLRYSDDEHSEEKTDENDQPIRVVRQEYLNEYNGERMELLSTENDIDIRQFDLEDFGNIDIDLPDMAMLNFFIIDEEAEKDTDVTETVTDAEIV